MFSYKRAICYSGYRENQSPITKVYPTYDEVLEDLKILEKEYDYIRMYDPYNHARTVLEVIRNENINLNDNNKILEGIINYNMSSLVGISGYEITDNKVTDTIFSNNDS